MLRPLGISIASAVTTLAEALRIVVNAPTVIAAASFYVARRKRTTAKRVNEVVAELLVVKQTRGAPERYLQD